MNTGPTHVTLRIYQPRAIHDEGPLRSWHLTRDEYVPYAGSDRRRMRRSC